MTTLSEFFDLLEKHDWFYNFSDDHRSWKSGKANLEKLQSIADESEAHRRLFLDYHQHIFSGEQWDRPKRSKPFRPEE